VNTLDTFPIFVVGASRSGTTLVYSILLSSGHFPIYEAETHLLEMCPAKYGNIENDMSFDRFINDWIHSKPFHRAGLDPFEFKKEAEKHHSSYTEFLAFFMDSTAQKQGKMRWAEQTPGHLFHMETLSKALPEAKFIHVIRDGRDVALSKRKIGWTGTRSTNATKQLIYAALNWKLSIMFGQACGKKLQGKYLEIRYEHIIGDLSNVLERLSSFAKIPIDEETVRNSSVGALGKPNTAFNERMDGVSQKGTARWKTALTEPELAVLNLIIGDTLKSLGYKVRDVHNSHLSRTRRWRLKTCSLIYLIWLNTKRVLRQETLLGRFTSRKLERSHL